MVEKVVVTDVDEKLAGCAVYDLGAGHSDGAAIILQAIAGFILDRGFLVGLVLHVCGQAAALNHEAIDDAMEDCLIVKTIVCILNEVGNSNRSIGGI